LAENPYNNHRDGKINQQTDRSNAMSTVNRLKKEKAAVKAVLREIRRRDLVAVQKQVNKLVEITSTDNYMAPAMYRKWAYYLNSGYINISALPLIEQDLREQLVMIEAGIDILENSKNPCTPLDDSHHNS
jgi:hypothetical protein